MDPETLFVKSCTATPGPTLKRIMPRARGSAAPILKRSSHITVVLAAKIADTAEAKPKRARKAQA
jgi:large subunit ribosomal protein L22